jgi:hypothetical protein
MGAGPLAVQAGATLLRSICAAFVTFIFSVAALIAKLKLPVTGYAPMRLFPPESLL